ncbi:metallophosphoesterase [Formosa sp. 3Alg 14/1]|uniref:metallophosphoesterase n=1 Tax=Formosa sp. 3Alg 14/1 TaxID=3382190 RepID=UPI0039BE9187
MKINIITKICVLVKSNKSFLVLFSLILLAIISCSNSTDEIDEKNEVEPPFSEDEIFQIAVLPDTQYYTSQKHGGQIEMFAEQINWIRNNAIESKIKYVVHLGDVVDHGHQQMEEWSVAKDILYKLETPLPGYPEGIPYGIAVGNHDQDPLGDPTFGSTDDGYNKYFGKEHFVRKSYYGGAHGATNNNDNHYDLFEVYNQKFIVLYIEYNEPGSEFYDTTIENSVFQWGSNILNQFEDHKVIIVSHSILARPEGSNSITTGGEGTNEISSTYTNQGDKIYNWFKKKSNVFMMLSGHRSGEGYRTDYYKGNTIKSFLSDYQSREDKNGNRNGGGGLMRTMEFNLTQNTLSIKTFSPSKSSIQMELDSDSFFTVKLFE